MEKSKRKQIMVIDDSVINLNVARKALEEEYDVILIPSGEKALTLFSKIIPDLILLDIEMPGMNGFEVIKALKESPSPICDIPVIFVTAKDDNNSEFEGLDMGAVDYIAKPFSFPLLCKRVGSHLALMEQQKELLNYSCNLEKMVDEKTKTIIEMQYAIVHVLSDMVEQRDGSTGGHLMRTQNYLRILVEAVKEAGLYHKELEPYDVEMIAQASQMHDVGKISIPDTILLKEGRLTAAEFEIMKTHATIGKNAIEHAVSAIQEKTFLEVAATCAGYHHERWDGTGYPYGLKGEDIPVVARMMAIVDVYDALISERPYKKPFIHEVAIEIIEEESGTHFDPLLVSVLSAVSAEFKRVAELYSSQECQISADGDRIGARR